MLAKKIYEIIKQLEPNFLNSNYLLAVSGGRDSVSLAHLLLENRINFSIAHCNFQLRGEESDQEEKFVKNLAKELNISCYTKRFNTTDFARSKKISIQEAARELRYNWFFKLLEEKKHNKIITAHHLYDDVETFFINLQRSSGIKGLAAISENNEKVLRPLLKISRSEIDEYIIKKKIAFKEDSSNLSDKYLRNSLRLKLIPYLEQNFPELLTGIQNSIPILKQNKILFESIVQEKKNELLLKENNTYIVSFKKLQTQNNAVTIFYEILVNFGFNFSDVKSIYNSLTTSETKHFYSKTHFITKNRTNFLISPLNNQKTDKNSFFIEKEQTQISTPFLIKFEQIENTKTIVFNKNQTTQYFDFEKIKFPIILRKNRVGDKFKPLGMKNNKKLSDFFINLKFSEQQKQNTWLLESNNQIISVVANRINEDFKVTESTKIIYKIQLL